MSFCVTQSESDKEGRVGRILEAEREEDIAAGNNVSPIFSQ